jgi:hypothetical protein
MDSGLDNTMDSGLDLGLEAASDSGLDLGREEIRTGSTLDTTGLSLLSAAAFQNESGKSETFWMLTVKLLLCCE